MHSRLSRISYAEKRLEDHMSSISDLKEARDKSCRLTVFLNLPFAPKNGTAEKNPNALFGGYDIG